MLKKALAAIIAIVALATGTIVAIVALAFALYAGLEPLLGTAGAAAIVAVLFMVVVLLLCVLILGAGGSHKRREDNSGLIERLLEIARDKPLLALGAAIAAGILAIRNPALIATILAAFMEKPRPRD